MDDNFDYLLGEVILALDELKDLGYVEEFFEEGNPEPLYRLTKSGYTYAYNLVNSN